MRFSVVVPTFNPQERILARVLDALNALQVPDGAAIECVLVDNRSDQPIEQLPSVREFLLNNGHSRVIREEMQGLTFARLAGIRASHGDAVVIFDDDNVPAPTYLRAAAECFREFPAVAVWGPGTIDVELLDPVPAWLQQRVVETHSYRRERFVQYGCVPASWQPFYPIGMGQVIRRDVADSYRRAVEDGRLKATDRKGGSLASGGDIQIVWEAIGLGFAAGIHPKLSVTHLIPESRTTLDYMKRLAFGCGMSYHSAFNQSFPQAAAPPRKEPTAWQDVAGLSRFIARRLLRGRVRFLSVDFANQLGLVCGRVIADGTGADHWTFKLAKRLGFR